MNANTKSKIYMFPEALTGTDFSYCPGCGHGIANKFIAEAIDEFHIHDRTVIVWPVGCSVFGYKFLKTDSILASHGKAPAVATGYALAVRITKPETIVLVYQGDGDLASIGMGEILHAANRGENLTFFFINNAVYGMTGGQMAPTTLVGQKTDTTPAGRDPQRGHGYPIKMCELVNQLEAPYFITRVSLSSIKQARKVKEAVYRAIRYQMEGKGFSFVEILSGCPTGWGLAAKPTESLTWIVEHMEQVFPVQEFRCREHEEKKSKEGYHEV